MNLSEANFLVVKFKDNDYTYAFEEALKLIWSMYDVDTRQHLIKLFEDGRLHETMIRLFDSTAVVMDILHGMRMSREWPVEPRSRADYISSIELEFFKDRSEFYDWKNGEWVYLDLATGEVQTL